MPPETGRKLHGYKWKELPMIQAINLLLSEGGCRITRSRKHNSCKLYGSHKERNSRFIQENVQSYARLYGDKDLD